MQRPPYTLENAPLLAGFGDHARAISAHAYPVSEATTRKAPIRRTEVNGRTGAKTAVIWGWAISRVSDLYTEELIGKFADPDMRDEVRKYEAEFRASATPSRRGENLKISVAFADDPQPAA